ncbi:MAG: NAD-dependent DNA ligase LigA [Bacteroidales bacterium]|nr:NAD-dependent DNA ligase LigA [Bacteroidales bacterium]
MDKTQARHKIEELKAVLWENSRRYYVENAPTMSDYDYDMLMKELEALEKEYPEFATPDSPTRKVGSDLDGLSDGFAQYPHKYPMLSLGNTYNIGEVEEFAARASKSLQGTFNYCCELKFDGTAICLTYRNGLLYRALTRGDGVVGDDVTANARQISNIPLKLKGSSWPEEFEIRGEVLMPYASFERLNAERLAAGQPLFANPRNAASGSLKLLDSREVARRGLFCTLYHIPVQSVSFDTHDEALRAAMDWGLPVSEHRRLCRDISEIEAYISEWDVRRRSLPFATDGIVIKINEMDCQRQLGYTSKFPRWAVAYKFKAEDALTRLVSIDYQVGRTGAVTPVANLEPVRLSGTVVKRATLNNADQMALMDIRVGDYVHVEKGGEIIPKITSVELSRRPSDAKPPVFPSVCPDCGSALVKAEDEAKWFCPNADGCPTQIKGKLVHFLSRKAMNVIAGDATIEQMYDASLVRTPADFYDLTKMQLVHLDGWQDRAADRFLESLKASREVPFERVLYALGIRYVGETTAKEIAAHFGSMDAIAAASREELLAVPDVGEVIAESVERWFDNPSHAIELQRLRASGLQFSSEGKESLSNALEGMTIVISGNFSISRDEMKKLIEANGGKNSSSVSSKTSYLLAGSKPGPEKIKKAAELGVQVISEKDLMSMLPSSGPSGEDEEPFSETLWG